MAFDATLIRDVWLLRWRNPEISDAVLILKGVREARQTAGRSLIYVAIAPADSPPPPERLQKAMGENMARVLESCDSIRLVFEGAGFGYSLKRAAMASIVLVSGLRGRVMIHNSVVDAIAKASPAERTRLSYAFETALRSGFLPASSANEIRMAAGSGERSDN